MEKFISLNKKNIFLILIFLFYFFFNLLRFDFHYFNLEWYFIEYAKHLNVRDYYFSREIFRDNQANTTFYPLLISLISNVNFNEINLIRLLRIINFFAFFTLVAIFWKYEKVLNYKNKIIFTLIILFSPVFFVYIFRVYPDILSFVLGYIGLFLIEKNKFKISLSIFLAAMSFLIKPISIILAPFYFIKIFKICENDLKKKLKLLMLYLFFIIFFYSLLFLFYEKSFFSKGYSEIYLNFSLKNSVYNFLHYLFYISFLILPFLVVNVLFLFKKKKYLFLYFIISFFFTILCNYYNNFKNSHGEMNYGFLTSFKFFYSSITIFFIFFCLICFLHNIFSKKKNLNLFFPVLISILMLSALVFRPAQRYLIYILPFVIYLQILIFQNNNIKSLFYFYFYFAIFIYLFVNIGHQYFQYTTLVAYKNIYEFTLNKNISKDTNPGIIFHSYGYKFNEFLLDRSDRVYPRKYKISECNLNTNSFYKKKINIFKNNYICLELKN